MSNFITRKWFGTNRQENESGSANLNPGTEVYTCACGASDDLMLCNGVLTCRSCTVQHIHRLQEDTVKKLPGGRHAG